MNLPTFVCLCVRATSLCTKMVRTTFGMGNELTIFSRKTHTTTTTTTGCCCCCGALTFTSSHLWLFICFILDYSCDKERSKFDKIWRFTRTIKGTKCHETRRGVIMMKDQIVHVHPSATQIQIKWNMLCSSKTFHARLLLAHTHAIRQHKRLSKSHILPVFVFSYTKNFFQFTENRMNEQQPKFPIELDKVCEAECAWVWLFLKTALFH